jgi:hypothetical protein
MECPDNINTTQLLEIIEGQSQTLNLSVIGNPNDITYTLYNDGVESLYVNILYNDIVILHITLIEKLWNVDPPLFSAWSTYEPMSSLEMFTITI